MVRAAPSEHYGWIAERAGVGIAANFRALEAVDDDGRIRAMVGYDGWTENAVCIHVAIESPIALRHVLRAGLALPFLELGKGVVVATVLNTNEASLRLVKHLGFREVYRGRDWQKKGVDIVVHEMRREDWMKENG